MLERNKEVDDPRLFPRKGVVFGGHPTEVSLPRSSERDCIRKQSGGSQVYNSRFLGLGLSERKPDAKTIWQYRERLKGSGMIKDLFAQFDGYLRRSGFEERGGQIIDAMLVRAPV